jgi:alpha-N-arabinofuranosidase
VGGMLITLLRHADRVKIACQAQLVNVIAPIMTVPGGPAWKQTIYYPYLHASLYGRGTALHILVDSPKYDSKDYTDVPILESAVVLNEEETELTLFAVNKGEEEMDISCCLRDFPHSRVLEYTVMAHDDLKAKNTAENPNRVLPHTSNNYQLKDNVLQVKTPGYSWNVIRIAV